MHRAWLATFGNAMADAVINVALQTADRVFAADGLGKLLITVA